MSMDGIIPYVLGGGGGGGGSSAATVAAMISGTEDTATASQGYSVGEYFIYNDALYIVTSPISQGDTITPGTNCDTTTVCENLTDLNGAITSVDGKTALINLDKIGLCRLSSDRLQLKGLNGEAQYVIEFNPVSQAITQSYTLDGQTFTTQWSISNKVEPINITPNSQSNYTFETGGELSVIRCGKIVQVNGGFVCNTPYPTSPGVLIATGLPHPKANTFVTLAQRNDTNVPTRAFVNTSGELYIRFGYASCNYDCSFTYIAE